MGCDGGTIPRRDELVKLKKKPEQKDKASELAYKWRHCALTQEKLVSPIVCCGLGRLYNKQAVIENLLSKSLPDTFSYIKNLKDVKDLKLSSNPAYKSDDDKNSPYICPVIGLEMTGRFRFVSLWSCGCVFSERAFKEIKSNHCVMCQQTFTENDVIVLNGTDEDIEILKHKMNVRKQQKKIAKKNKNKVDEPSSSIATSSKCAEKISDAKSTNISTNSKSLKKEENGVDLKSHSHKRPADLKPIHDPLFKKAKDEYSVAKDPNATEVFKSIFTSHQTEKQQDRAHWITYNPFYN